MREVMSEGGFAFGRLAFGDVQTQGHRGRYACVRLRCVFLKFMNRQMPHFALLRAIGICRFMNFENQSPRTNTRISAPMALRLN